MTAGLICECIAYFAGLHKRMRVCALVCVVVFLFLLRNLARECPALNELFFGYLFGKSLANAFGSFGIFN